jgi:hypothetical protein
MYVFAHRGQMSARSRTMNINDNDVGFILLLMLMYNCIVCDAEDLRLASTKKQKNQAAWLFAG